MLSSPAARDGFGRSSPQTPRADRERPLQIGVPGQLREDADHAKLLEKAPADLTKPHTGGGGDGECRIGNSRQLDQRRELRARIKAKRRR